MISFAAKLRSGQRFLGLGLSTEDILRLKTGDHLVLDLESVGVGLWIKEADGSRTFVQPRDSNILIMAGDTHEDVGALLQIELPPKKT